MKLIYKECAGIYVCGAVLEWLQTEWNVESVATETRTHVRPRQHAFRQIPPQEPGHRMNRKQS